MPTFWPAGFYGDLDPQMEDVLLSRVTNYIRQYPVPAKEAAKLAEKAITLARQWARLRTTVPEFLENRGQLLAYLAGLAIRLAHERLPASVDWLNDILSRMSPADRRLLVWFYLDRLSERDIALLLQVAPTVVKQRLEEAKARLTKWMDQMNTQDADGWRP